MNYFKQDDSARIYKRASVIGGNEATLGQTECGRCRGEREAAEQNVKDLADLRERAIMANTVEALRDVVLDIIYRIERNET